MDVFISLRQWLFKGAGLLLIYICPCLVFAQDFPEKYTDFTIIGRVTSSKDVSPLAEATVTVEPVNIVLKTDKEGYFSVRLPLGTYTFRVSYVGYKSYKTTLKVRASTRITVVLEENWKELNEVIVSDESIDRNVSKTETAITKLSIKTIQKMPALMGEVDIVRSLLLLPGVSTVGEGATGINVRGGGIDQNLILLDDAPVYNSSHLMGLFSIFNPDAVSNVTFYRSGIPAGYGGRASSVLDVRIQNPTMDSVQLQGGIGLISSRLVVNTPLVKKKVGLLVASRGAFSDYLFQLLPNATLRQTRANFYDITAKVAFRVNDKNGIYLTGYLGNDQFKAAGDSLSSAGVGAASSRFAWQTLTGSLRWNHTFSPQLQWNTYLAWSDYVPQVTNEDSTYAFRWNSHLKYRSMQSQLVWNLANHSIDAGLQGILYRLQPGNRVPSEGSSILPLQLTPEKAVETGIYVNDLWEISKSVSLMFGVRYSQFMQLGPSSVYSYQSGIARDSTTITGSQFFANNRMVKSYGGLEPRMVLKIGVSSGSSVKVSYTRMKQYVQLISNTVAAMPTDRWKISDTYIRPQISDHFSAGYYRNFHNDDIETYVELYYKKLTNVTDYKDGANLLVNRYPETVLLQGSGFSYGVESMIRKVRGRLTGWVSYTYAQTRYLINGTGDKEKINGGNYYPPNFNKPHIANLYLNWMHNRRISYAINFTYSSGRPTTYPTDKYAVGGIYIPNYINRNQNRIPDYHRLDLSMTIGPNPAIKHRWKGSWVLSVYNVYARKNAFSVFFQTSNEATSLFYRRSNAYQLSIFATVIPSVTYNFQF